jgi:DNA repair exonuclease SbcCD ATPase subunit
MSERTREVERLEAEVERLKGIEAERDRLRAEIDGIRSNCYYACVSKRAANAALKQLHEDLNEVIAHWRGEAKRLEAERDALVAPAPAGPGGGPTTTTGSTSP